MSEQSEALRLADMIRDGMPYDEAEVEAELRRLHEECNDLAHQLNQSNERNGRLRAEVEALHQRHHDDNKEYTRVLAENETLRADAERYRWVRDRATSSHTQQATAHGVHYPTTWHIVTGGSDTDIDAAIDAVRKEKE